MSATANKIKGKLKKLEGRVTGDKVREAEGTVQEAAGDVGSTVKAGLRKAKAAVSKKVVTTKVGRKAAATKLTP